MKRPTRLSDLACHQAETKMTKLLRKQFAPGTLPLPKPGKGRTDIATEITTVGAARNSRERV